jgi:leucyl-tRNA---protein transferase
VIVRALATIADHILRAVDAGLPYVYLGYWISQSRKMAYKTRFRPMEVLGASGWDEHDFDTQPEG